MRVIIVDDERNARENLMNKLNQIPHLSIMGEFTNPLEAFLYLKQNSVDIVFLDIEMYEMTGIEMAKQIKDIQPKVNIVFVTGYSEYMPQALSLRASGYILKPATLDAIIDEIENLRYPVKYGIPSKGVFVQTFGNFDVFVDGKPLVFHRAKSKELFAYLIDRHGSSVTNVEIAAILWEDRKYDLSLQSQTRNIIAYTLKTFREANIEDIIIKNRNSIAVDKSKFECDYYDLLNWDMRAVNSYSGQYMINYSWAEMTTGVLSRKTDTL